MKVINLTILILLISCANKGALTGGEADKIPPEIVFSKPAKDTVNVSYLPEFQFEFSERVDRRSFESSLYTIPIEKKRMKFTWDGWNEVNVVFVDSIKDLRTYQLIVSKGLKDLHGVTSFKEFKIAFTRDSKLDRNFIKGHLNYRDLVNNVRIALLDENYKIKYIGDLSDIQNYEINFIKKSDYKIIFFEDKDQNLKIDFQKEKIAIPNYTINFNNPELEINSVYFFNTDTLAPIIKSADSLSKGIITLDIDDKLDLNKSNFYLIDSLNHVERIFKILKKSNKYYGYYKSGKLTFPALLKYDNIEDIYGNRNDSIKQTIEIYESQKTDTLDFQISSINLKNKDQFKSLKPEITIRFNSNLIWNSDWDKQISLKSETNPINILIQQANPEEIKIRLESELIPSNKYEFEFTTDGIHNFYNSILKDSVIKYTMYSMSRNKFGSLSFQLTTKSKNTLMYNLFKYESAFEIYKSGELKSNLLNKIENIEGGIYKIEIFEDKNMNSKLDLGTYKPYQLSEKIKFITDSIPIRSNWDRVLEEIIFD